VESQELKETARDERRSPAELKQPAADLAA
jgi:hypothetical protein